MASGGFRLDLLLEAERLPRSTYYYQLKELDGHDKYKDLKAEIQSEMFYGYEKAFHSLEQLEQAIVDYIDYYNNKRIKVKLKGLSPVQYRTKSFG